MNELERNIHNNESKLVDFAHRATGRYKQEKFRKLPFPKRAELGVLMETLCVQLGEVCYADILRLSDSGLLGHEVINKIHNDHQVFKELVGSLWGRAGASNSFLNPQLALFRASGFKNQCLTITEAVNDHLLMQHMSDSEPAGTFVPVVNHSFVEWGEARRSPFRLSNKETGSHVVEGAFVSQINLGPDRAPEALKGLHMDFGGEPVRVLEITFTCSPSAEANGILDDHFQSIIFPIRESDESRSFMEVAVEILSHYANGRENDPSYIPHTNEENFAYLELLTHLCKVLRYMNKLGVLVRRDRDYDKLAVKLNRAKDAARDKLQTKLDLVVNRRWYGPERIVKDERLSYRVAFESG